MYFFIVSFFHFFSRPVTDALGHWFGNNQAQPAPPAPACIAIPSPRIPFLQHSMLAIMAKRVGYWAGGCLGLPTPGVDLGEAFAFWVSLDAFVVLSGAVLTAYVGISGLLARMAKDRCLPQFILRKVGRLRARGRSGGGGGGL